MREKFGWDWSQTFIPSGCHKSSPFSPVYNSSEGLSFSFSFFISSVHSLIPLHIQCVAMKMYSFVTKHCFYPASVALFHCSCVRLIIKQFESGGRGRKVLTNERLLYGDTGLKNWPARFPGFENGFLKIGGKASFSSLSLFWEIQILRALNKDKRKFTAGNRYFRVIESVVCITAP